MKEIGERIMVGEDVYDLEDIKDLNNSIQNDGVAYATYVWICSGEFNETELGDAMADVQDAIERFEQLWIEIREEAGLEE